MSSTPQSNAPHHSPQPDAEPDALRTDDEVVDETKVSQIIEEYESESAARQLQGWWRIVAGMLAAGLSIYALYWTQHSITTQVYRASFLMVALILTFLVYPLFKRNKRVTILDLVLVGLTIASLGYLLLNYQSALQRITRPNPTEVVLGGVLIALILEATRRTTGWVLSLTAMVFLAYAYFGSSIPAPFGHRGQSVGRIIGQNYLTLEGIFGIPLDVAASFIVLFTIYGAVLEYSGAGKFFIDWSFAALGKSKNGAGPGRTVTAAGFLLGTVSGSGVATTVTLGSLAWPLLKKAGYDRDTAGGVLSAAGIGALLSPPTLGAAAFLIAEYLDVSYLQVLLYATIPTLLYYLSCLLMIEADSRRMHTRPVDLETPSLWQLTARYGYHFSSLFAIIILMAFNMTPFMAVFWSIVIAFGLSFLRPETRLTSLKALGAGVALAAGLYVLNLAGIIAMQPSVACFWGLMFTTLIAALVVLRQRLQRRTTSADDGRVLAALESGGRGVLSVAATTATAGIIVSVVTLTGLGLKLSAIIVDLSGGTLFLTVLYAALAVWVLGLAVPVTASYIIAAVIIVPAMTTLGINVAAAHMFIFYYAVLADVSPPTALAPFAAAAITGGNPFKTTMLAWKYCLPAFLVPFMFTLSPQGTSLLMIGDPVTIIWTTVTACVAVAALAIAFGGWFIREAHLVERGLAGIGGLALLYADPVFDMLGFVLLVVAVGLHLVRVRRTPAPAQV